MTSSKSSADPDGDASRGGPGDDGPRRRGRDGRSRREYGRALSVGLLLSLAGHLLAVEFSPTLKAPELPRVVSDFRAIEVRPVEVEPPPPPDPVSLPEVPRVRETRVDATSEAVAPPALDASPEVGELPPPPPPADDGWDRPSYIRHQVAPRPDREENQRRRLDRHYPPVLEASGVEGVVDLWIYVDPDGRVTRSRVISSSGHSQMDTAAVRVVRDQKYLPALNRDRPVGVWVTQRVCFVQEPRHEIEDTDDCVALVRGD